MMSSVKGRVGTGEMFVYEQMNDRNCLRGPLAYDIHVYGTLDILNYMIKHSSNESCVISLIEDAQ